MDKQEVFEQVEKARELVKLREALGVKPLRNDEATLIIALADENERLKTELQTAASAEREACAEIADYYEENWNPHENCSIWIAQEIRARNDRNAQD